MARKRKKNRNYFTAVTEAALVEYMQPETTQRQREFLTKTELYPAFDKLCENIINTFKFPYIELEYTDLKNECVAFIFEKIMPKFTSGRGKAYSYISVSIKNYLIQKNNSAYKKRKEKIDISYIDIERDVVDEVYQSDLRSDMNNFIKNWRKYYFNKLEKLHPELHEAKIAEAILKLVEDAKNLELFNKRAIYILIREQVQEQIKTQDITNVCNLMKENFYVMYESYKVGGIKF